MKSCSPSSTIASDFIDCTLHLYNASENIRKLAQEFRSIGESPALLGCVMKMASRDSSLRIKPGRRNALVCQSPGGDFGNRCCRLLGPSTHELNFMIVLATCESSTLKPFNHCTIGLKLSSSGGDGLLMGHRRPHQGPEEEVKPISKLSTKLLANQGLPLPEARQTERLAADAPSLTRTPCHAEPPSWCHPSMPPLQAAFAPTAPQPFRCHPASEGHPPQPPHELPHPLHTCRHASPRQRP
mmetsp:Transcript_142735/g.456106  ORF Transcript_142735/g.456106 Transcript_142735/m.456106 type:complete len:241 (-) Transcript_142735:1595-2317(-)